MKIITKGDSKVSLVRLIKRIIIILRTLLLKLKRRKIIRITLIKVS